MYFVIPKFQEIFNDFDVELPGLTLWLVDASKWVAGNASPDQSVPGAIWILLMPFLLFGLFKLIRVTGPGKAATLHLRKVTYHYSAPKPTSRGKDQEKTARQTPN